MFDDTKLKLGDQVSGFKVVEDSFCLFNSIL